MASSSSTYAYPDTGDEITARFIDQAEPYAGYWDGSDQRAMARTAMHLAGLLGPRATTRGLDVGCGPGRLLPWMSRLAGQVTATDPDPARLAEARAQAAALADTGDITVTDTPVTELTGDPFDLVLCSHVIQHIPSADVVPLLGRLRDVTAPGGFLVLIYCRAPIGADRYTVDRIEDGRVLSDIVDRERFDAVAATGASGAAGASLPIRFLDPARLAESGAALGWAERWTWSYHVMEDLGILDARIDRDIAVNSSPEMRGQFGRDMVAVWQRRD